MIYALDTSACYIHLKMILSFAQNPNSWESNPISALLVCLITLTRQKHWEAHQGLWFVQDGENGAIPCCQKLTSLSEKHKSLGGPTESEQLEFGTCSSCCTLQGEKGSNCSAGLLTIFNVTKGTDASPWWHAFPQPSCFCHCNEPTTKPTIYISPYAVVGFKPHC